MAAGLACGLSDVLGKVLRAGWGAGEGLTRAVVAPEAASTAGLWAAGFGAWLTAEWLRLAGGWSLMAVL